MITAEGGKGAPSTRSSSTSGGGGDGGSGGGGGTYNNEKGGEGGSNGGNGIDGTPSSSHPGGVGQGITTREFGEPSGKLYAGGGGGGRSMVSQTPIVSMGGAGGGGNGGWVNQNNWRNLYKVPTAGAANTGGGGGGGYQLSQDDMTPGAAGGSGIVCLRVAAPLPELAGTWVLNERLYAPVNAIQQAISFSTSGLSSSGQPVTYQCTRMDVGPTNLTYTFAGGNINTYDFSTNQWSTYNKYNTLTFPSGATASDEFRTWLASNATKQ